MNIAPEVRKYIYIVAALLSAALIAFRVISAAELDSAVQSAVLLIDALAMLLARANVDPT